MDLFTGGTSHNNNRPDVADNCKVGSGLMDELSKMLASLSTVCGNTTGIVSDFLIVEELLNLPIEAETEEPITFDADEIEGTAAAHAGVENEGAIVDEDAIVDDEEPPPVMSLQDA